MVILTKHNHPYCCKPR